MPILLHDPIRPASILLMTTSTIDAGLVEQSLPDIFPDGMWSIEPDRIRPLNFDDAKATHAFYTQHMVGNFREATFPELK